MNGCPPDEPSLRRFLAEIATTPPRPHHAALLARANHLLPQCDFRFALTQGGWHRPGGVIRADGSRVSDDLFGWAEAELEACGGDIEALVERHLPAGLLATRLVGHDHYFVAAYGRDPAAFLQLEIEELQEVVDRPLIDPDRPPTDLMELTDPSVTVTHVAQPIGHPYYRYRRLSDMRQTVARQPVPAGGQSELARFLSDWSASSAAERGHFCDHWVVALREHQDRYRNIALQATPVSRHARKLRPFHWQPEVQGVELAAQLQAFDRVAGYPAAWYFHLVSGALTPPAVAHAIARDLEAEFRYLPDRDARLLARWLEAPYSV